MQRLLDCSKLLLTLPAAGMLHVGASCSRATAAWHYVLLLLLLLQQVSCSELRESCASGGFGHVWAVWCPVLVG